ncbi:Hypothetical_protein [Hexamita inflata]|uniref:Hypothetical_protein n=1 Tax=Hexamita inflata TaxID=28002 RepID=A0ABP1HYY5_9EUKA
MVTKTRQNLNSLRQLHDVVDDVLGVLLHNTNILFYHLKLAPELVYAFTRPLKIFQGIANLADQQPFFVDLLNYYCSDLRLLNIRKTSHRKLRPRKLCLHWLRALFGAVTCYAKKSHYLNILSLGLRLNYAIRKYETWFNYKNRINEFKHRTKYFSIIFKLTKLQTYVYLLPETGKFIKMERKRKQC